MNKNIVTVVIVFLIFIFYIFISSFTKSDQKKQNSNHKPVSTSTMVSLSPAITEMVYMLGLEKNLIGVTNYCAYPPSAKKITKIGGYYDPSLETIDRLKPDYVFAGTEHSNIIGKLDKLGISHLTLDYSTPKNIMDSIRKLGALFGKDKTAEKIVTDLQKQLTQLQKKAASLPKKRVMIVLGGDMADTKDQTKCIVGKDFFYSALLDKIGAENVVKKSPVSYPIVSKEGIITLNPDVIIEIVPQTCSLNKTDIISSWKNYSYVNAVKNGNVFVLKGDYLFVPGPRFVKIARDLFNVIYAGDNHKKGILTFSRKKI